MALHYGYGGIVHDSLVFHMDVSDTFNCYGGPTTTNILSDTSLSNYNNVSSSVRTELVKTPYKFRDAFIWEQVLTPLDASGVGWLSNGSNPGLGVVTGGGGGTGGRYTGHSIFFKPTVPMHSSPIYTHYSNIGGWQSSTNYEYVGDGWYKASVVWYDSVSRSDGKYWAINPLSATLNVPIYIYWAGPFKEDENRNLVSPYTQTARTVAIKDLSPTGVTITPANDPYNYYGKLYFDGSNDHLRLGSSNVFNQFDGDFTVSVWAKRSSSGGTWGNLIGDYYTTGAALTGEWQIMMSSSGQFNLYRVGDGYVIPVTTGFGANVWHNVVVTRRGTTVTMYVNSNVVNTATNSNTFGTATGNVNIGIDGNNSSEPFTGEIAVVQIYRKGLSAAEVLQNYNHYKSRFNI